MRNDLLVVLESELASFGFADAAKLYVVIWGGTTHWARLGDGCGGESFTPPDQVVRVVVSFDLTADGAPCAYPLAGGIEAGIQDVGIVHEVIHALGFVPPGCAPHADSSWHVTDSPADLLWGGEKSEVATEIDAGHDDYYRHGIPGCLDLATSAFLDPLPDAALPPPGWPPGS